MMLNLSKPLIIFDLETTGLNLVTDRIVEYSLLKVLPDGSKEVRTQLINPGMPIPPESTRIHGISDEDVADKPLFKDMAAQLYSYIGNSDLAGYNSNKFDIPFIIEEFLKAGIDFSLKGRRLIDVQNIFHKMEPRTLKAAYKFYCGREIENAHSAEADMLATYEVLLAQIQKYADTPYTDHNGKESIPIKNDMQALYEFTFNKRNADIVGHIVFNEKNQETFNFGKYKGKVVEEVFKTDLSYYDWIQRSAFPELTKRLVQTIKLRSQMGGQVQSSLFD
jgi:DNA polymerase III subunit epsilon